MPRATCRCGQKLSFPADGPDRVICPKCNSRIRVKRAESAATAVPSAENSKWTATGTRGSPALRPSAQGATRCPAPGRKCRPDCGRVVPVPATTVSTATLTSRSSPGSGHAEVPTEVMSAAEVALDRWSESHRERPGPVARVGQHVRARGRAAAPTELAFPDSPPAAAGPAITSRPAGLGEGRGRPRLHRAAAAPLSTPRRGQLPAGGASVPRR
ncbi:MAG: hypothetical protein U0835_11050 [Isosphaeraceae bacterium]